MADCGIIDASITYDCENPLQGGASPKLYLANYDDVTGYTEDGSTDNLITDLTFATGKVTYQYEGYRNSLVPTVEAITPDSGQTLYKHQLGFFIFDKSQATKNQIQKMALGRFIAIIENNGKDANSFEVYGLNKGLEMVAQPIRAVNENNGAYTLLMASPEGEEEAKLPQTLFDTDYATTLAKVVAYLT